MVLTRRSSAAVTSYGLTPSNGVVLPYDTGHASPSMVDHKVVCGVFALAGYDFQSRYYPFALN